MLALLTMSWIFPSVFQNVLFQTSTLIGWVVAMCTLGCFINYTLQKKRCNTSTHPSRVYINQLWKIFFPKTSLEGLATWSKKAKIDQNRRGGRMTVAWSFNSYQIVISSKTDCVSELWIDFHAPGLNET